MAVSLEARKLRADGEPIADLSIAEPAFATPSNVCEAASRAMRDAQTQHAPPDGTPAVEDQGPLDGPSSRCD